MKRKLTALLLAAAMLLSAGAASVLVRAETGDGSGAASDDAAEAAPAADTEQDADTEQATEEAVEQDAEEAGEDTEEPSLAGPDDGGVREPDAIDEPVNERAEYNAQKLERLLRSVTVTPVTRESVTFAELEGMMRENNLSILGYEEYVKFTQSVDYNRLEDTLGWQINSFSAVPLSMMDSIGTYASSQLSLLYTQYDNLRDGKLQRDNASLARQMRYYQDMTVMGAETLYVVLVGLEDQKTSYERQLASLDRTVEEMELRYKLGQISALRLSEVKAGRASLTSGIETLNMNIRTYKMQLENLLGANLTGKIGLGGLPAVTEAQIAAMDVEADLKTARSRSYQLLAAGLQLESDQDTFKTTAASYGYDDWNAGYLQARSTWLAAQDTYNAALQSYELKFRTLYEQVRDYYQVWTASKVSLASQRKAYEAAELKFQQGTVSHNALLSAQDELRTAEDTVNTNANNLFSSYNTYRWAVEHGIVN